MAFKEFTGDLDAPDAAPAALRYRAFEGELDKPDSPPPAAAPTAPASAPAAAAPAPAPTTPSPAEAPQRRVMLRARAEPQMTEDQRGAALLGQPSRSAAGDGAVSAEFIDKFRERMSTVPAEHRLKTLRTIAETNSGVYGRAAKAVLSDVEQENRRGPDSASDEALAAAALKAPQLPQNKGQTLAAPRRTRFADVTPSYGDILDGTSTQDVARRRELAAGLGEERGTQKVQQWGAEDKRKAKAVADAAAKADKPRTWSEVGTDTGIKLLQGVLGAADSASGLVNLASYGALRGSQQRLGLNPNAGTEVNKELGTHLSEKAQGAEESVEQADGFVGTAKALWDRPLAIAGGILESASSMLLPMGAVRGAMGTIAAGAARKALAAGATEAEAAAYARKALESTRSAVKMAWAAHAGEGAESAGQIAQQALQANPDDRSAMYWGVPSGFATAFIGRMAGKVPGFGDAEAALFSGHKALSGTGNYATRVGKATVQEGLFQEAGQSAAEQGFTNLATNKPFTEGMGAATAQGLVVGGAMGGVHAGAHPVFHGASTAYDAARAKGFNVDPPLTTDPPETQRSKTDGIFQNLAAQYGVSKAAVKTALDKAQGMSLDKLGGFYQRYVGALQKRNLTGAPVDDHALDTLAAGPVEPPEDPKASAQAAKDAEQQGAQAEQDAARLDDLTRKARGTPEETIKAPDGMAIKVAAAPPAALSPEEGAEYRALLERQQAAAPAAPVADEDFTGLADNPIDQAAHAAATSPTNDLPEPTPAQVEAGNYQKGHTRIGGLDISIENPQNSTRRSKPDAPVAWESTMKDAHYGYIRGTTGMDGDHVDTFVKPGTPEAFDGTAFVVDQVDPKTGEPDEHKVMLGYGSEAEARAAYQGNYEPGWKGLGAITPVPMPALKEWLASGDLSQPYGPRKTPDDGRRTTPADGSAQAPAAGGGAGGDQPRRGRDDRTDGGEQRAATAVPGESAANDARGAAAAGPARNAGLRTDPVEPAKPASGRRVIAQVGMSPTQATPLELRDNEDGTSTPFIDGREALDFDSGEPISVPAGATNQQAVDAIKAAGAFGRRTKVFKLEQDAPAATAAAPDASTTPGRSIKVNRQAIDEKTVETLKIKQRADQEEAPAPTPAVDAATMPEDEIARYAGQMIDIPVAVGDSGKTATLTMDAAAAVRDVQSRLAAARSLLGCLK